MYATTINSPYHLFREAEAKGITIQSIDQNAEIVKLENEILSVLGLPLTEEFQETLNEFGRAKVLTDDLIDDTLIRLADTVAFYLTLSKLEEM